MDSNLWILLGTILFGTGGAASLAYSRWKDGKQLPLDASTTNVTNSATISGLASEWVAYQDKKMREQDERIKQQGEQIEELHAMQTALQKEFELVQQRNDRWTNWYDRLGFQWAEHREQPQPPPPPYTL